LEFSDDSRIEEHFSQLEDPRSEHNKRYELMDIPILGNVCHQRCPYRRTRGPAEDL